MDRTFPYLIPHPRSLVFDSNGGTVRISPVLKWADDANLEAGDSLPLELLNETIRSREGAVPEIVAADPAEQNDISQIQSVAVQPSFSESRDAYKLTLAPGEITIFAASVQARYYAMQTLRQLVINYGRTLPCLTIEDWPDYKHRGFMHDVSRGKVPKLETLYQLVDTLGFLKYNQLQLYIEHTFAFEKHPAIGEGHSPLTAEDIRALDAHCKIHHIALVPNLQSFGHASHILGHEQYHHLAESEYRGGWTLSPVEPGTYELLRELYAEFLPNFSHREYFNVGCDETWDLGKGKSAELAAKLGLGRVYLGHLLHVRKLVHHHSYRMMFWGDIIGDHPELVPEIPKDVVLLNWWYEAHGDEKKYKDRVTPAKKAGLEHWVCPGTSSWNSFFFRMKNARVNIRAFAKAGLWGRAAGLLVTDWGDNGHYNFLSYSLWPIAWAADAAWNAKAPAAANKFFDERFALLLLGDPAGHWIKPLRLLGNLYLDFGVRIANNSPERWFFTGNPEPRRDRLGVSGELKRYNEIKERGIKKALRDAEKAASLLAGIEPTTPALERIRDEWLLGAHLAAHACRRVLWHNLGQGDPALLKSEVQNLMGQFQVLWLARNRKSDLESDLYDFNQIIQNYQSDHPMPVTF